MAHSRGGPVAQECGKSDELQQPARRVSGSLEPMKTNDDAGEKTSGTADSAQSITDIHEAWTRLPGDPVQPSIDAVARDVSEDCSDADVVVYREGAMETYVASDTAIPRGEMR